MKVDKRTDLFDLRIRLDKDFKFKHRYNAIGTDHFPPHRVALAGYSSNRKKKHQNSRKLRKNSKIKVV